MMAHTNNQACLPWKIFLNENWLSNETIPHEQRRVQMMNRWAKATQEYRDRFIERARGFSAQELANHDYYGDIPNHESRIINALSLYPCLRTNFSAENHASWRKVKLFLNLDEQLSPLAKDELPPVIEDERFKDLDLGSYAERFIFGKANFNLMGMSDYGKPYCYYHILMIADKRTFSDGTLLHVDFDVDGKPEFKHRYLAIDTYQTWTKHLNTHCSLRAIERSSFHGGHSQSFDLSRSAVDILKDEMESREVNIEDARDLHQLAQLAVSTVDPSLLSTQ